MYIISKHAIKGQNTPIYKFFNNIIVMNSDNYTIYLNRYFNIVYIICIYIVTYLNACHSCNLQNFLLHL